MNIDDIKKLILTGESTTLEFKKSLANLKAGMETLCAFLNASGGTVLIGVSDTGKLIGQSVTDQTRLEIANLVNKLEPAANIALKYIPLPNKLSIIALTAKPIASCVPYAFNGRPFWRLESSTRLMPQERYQQLLSERLFHATPWDAQIATQAHLDDLDHEAIIDTLQDCIQRGRLQPRHATSDPLAALRLLKLTRNNDILNAAVILFLKNEELMGSNHLIRLARFKGINKSHPIDSQRVYGHAFTQLSAAEDFCLKHLSITSHFSAGKLAREDVPDYPPRAIREALVNAISHRDYCMAGASISLLLFDDRLEITSPGRLPAGITLSDLHHEHDSQPRNERIVHVLYRRGLVESVGTGTQEMIETCKQAGKPIPKYIERSNTFVVRFPAREKPNITIQLSARQAEIIEHLSTHHALSAGELLKRLSSPPAERTLRDDLSKLKKLDLINDQGRGRGALWSLTPNKNKAE